MRRTAARDDSAKGRRVDTQRRRRRSAPPRRSLHSIAVHSQNTSTKTSTMMKTMSQKKTCLAAQQKMATTITLLVQRPYLRRLPRILLPQKATSYFTLGHLGPIFSQLLTHFFVYTYIWVALKFLYKDHISHWAIWALYLPNYLHIFCLHLYLGP